MTARGSEYDSISKLTGRLSIPHESEEAQIWIKHSLEANRPKADRNGKFVAINGLVLFAPGDVPHSDVYEQAMSEDSPHRNRVLEEVAAIRDRGLVTLGSSFVTDSGMFGIYSSPGESESAVVELNDKSFYFGRANFTGRLQTIDHVRQGLASIGLDGVKVEAIY